MSKTLGQGKRVTGMNETQAVSHRASSLTRLKMCVVWAMVNGWRRRVVGGVCYF